ncbi:MAG: GNAT family N-acetyltransferase [Myxococcaceae bacterium]
MSLTIRPIRAEDDVAVAKLIRTVMPEFGAVGPGFAIMDPEVDHMSAAYPAPRAAYFVVTDDAGKVVGGGGFAPLEGGDGGTCELRKMYFLKEIRGQGMGEKMVRKCLDGARAAGFGRCYLETLTGMTAAMKLYEKLGFQKTCAEGATGHSGCDRFYALKL